MHTLRVFIFLIGWIGTRSGQDAPLAMNFTYQKRENSSKIHVTLTCLATGFSISATSCPETMTITKLSDNTTAQHIARSCHRSYMYWKVLLRDATCLDAGTYTCAVTGQQNVSTTTEVPLDMLKCKDESSKHLLAVLVTLSVSFVLSVNGVLLFFGIRQKKRKEFEEYVRWTENTVFSGNRTAIEMPIINTSACQDELVPYDQQAVTSSEKLSLVEAVALHNSFYSNRSSDSDRVEAVEEASELIYGTTCVVMNRESVMADNGYETPVVLREKHGVRIIDFYYESKRKDTTYVLADQIPCEESLHMGTMGCPNSNQMPVNCLEETTTDTVKHKSSDEIVEAERRLGSVADGDLN